MTKRPDWRSSEYVDTLKNLDRAGFAWEFLRRNPAYREEYDRLDEDPEESASSPKTVGGNWGLSFRLRSLTRRDCRAGFMAA
jgi:hypothetical protein